MSYPTAHQNRVMRRTRQSKFKENTKNALMGEEKNKQYSEKSLKTVKIIPPIHDLLQAASKTIGDFREWKTAAAIFYNFIEISNGNPNEIIDFSILKTPTEVTINTVSKPVCDLKNGREQVYIGDIMDRRLDVKIQPEIKDRLSDIALEIGFTLSRIVHAILGMFFIEMSRRSETYLKDIIKNWMDKFPHCVTRYDRKWLNEN